MTETRSTKRQKELLNFVDSYREIMRALGYKSVSTVAIHIDGLITKGYLKKRDNSARSLEVVTAKFDGDVVKKSPTAAQEKWLVAAVNERFTAYEEASDPKVLDELYVLIGSLKILGLLEAHVASRSRLVQYTKS
jgi:hypothetical protein